MTTVRYRFPTLLLVAIFVASSSFGQDPQPEFRPVKPAANYEIHATYDQITNTVVATADIDYRPSTPTNELWFTLPSEVTSAGKGEDFILDSLLLDGAPVDLSRSIQDKKLLRVPLSETQQSGVHIFLSFTLKTAPISAPLLLTNSLLLQEWFPKLIESESPQSKSKVKSGTTSSVVAEYDVALTVDTSLTAAAPGDLKNVREHFGILPDRGDTLLFDLRSSALDQPRWPSDQKTYYWQNHAASGFYIAIGKSPLVDEAISHGLKLIVHSTAKMRGQVRTELISSGRSVLGELYRLLGTPPNPVFTVIYSESPDAGFSYGNLIVLPTRIRDKEIVIASLAVQMAKQYFSPSHVVDSSRGLPWAEGAAIYTATEVLHKIYGLRGYDLIEKFGDWRFPLRKIGQPMLTGSPFGWLESARAPQNRWSRDDSLVFEQLFVVPSALHAIGSLVNEPKLWDMLRRYSMDSRSSALPPANFKDSLVQLGDGVTQAMLAQWEDYGRRFDWSIHDARVQKTYSGAILSGRIERSALREMPVEVGIVVPSGDTLSKSVNVGREAIGANFSIEVLDTPRAIIIDPHKYVPDSNRGNNVYILGSDQARRTATGKEYPAFRRLIRGE